MDITQALVLALLQGATEFLPVSSSAHLVILPSLLGWSNYLLFDVVVHFGTLCAVIFYYRKTLGCMLFSPQNIALEATQTSGRELRCYLAVGSLPILLVGALLHDVITEHLRTPLLIAAMTIVFAFFLWMANSAPVKTHKLSVRTALWIGVAQALALIPGVSRSGIALTAGRLLGLGQRSAADFAFLLAIPVIALATLYELFLALNSRHFGLSLWPLLVGFVGSAGIAFLSIGWFLRFVEKVGLLPFVIYRFLLGAVLLFIYL